LHDNNVTQFTVKHYSYINATTGIYRMTYLLTIITLIAPSPISNQIPNTLFDIISLIIAYSLHIFHFVIVMQHNNFVFIEAYIASMSYTLLGDAEFT